MGGPDSPVALETKCVMIQDCSDTIAPWGWDRGGKEVAYFSFLCLFFLSRFVSFLF